MRGDLEPLKRLLVVYHSFTGGTERMARAVLRGAVDEGVSGVEVEFLRCREAGADNLVRADALILGTPENFGYMSGAMKDFFDRTFYPTQGRVEGLPSAYFVKGGNDGTGALGAIRRIAKGYPLREVQAPVICAGALTKEVLEDCRELGTMMAAGLELGMY